MEQVRTRSAATYMEPVAMDHATDRNRGFRRKALWLQLLEGIELAHDGPKVLGCDMGSFGRSSHYSTVGGLGRVVCKLRVLGSWMVRFE